MRLHTIAAALAALILFMPGEAVAQMTKVPAGKARIIDKHNVCRVVENTNAQDIMIPHRDRSEWSFGANAFLSAARQGVNVRSCNERVVDVDSNTFHYTPFTGTCAVDVQGDVYCWGVDQTARGSSAMGGAQGGGLIMHSVANAPKRITGIPPMDKVATTGDTSCAATSGAGEIWCWGVGLAPFKRAGVTGIVEMEASYFQHLRGYNDSINIDLFCGKKSDDTMWCWMVDGSSSAYARAPFQVAKPIAGAIGTFDVAEGALYWRIGRNTYISYLRKNPDSALRTIRMPRDPRDLTQIKVMNWGFSWREYMNTPDTVDYTNGCAVKSDGTLWCWGQSLDDRDRGDQAFDTVWPGLGVTALDGEFFRLSQVAPRGGNVKHLIHSGSSGLCVVYTDNRSWCNRLKHNIQRSWTGWNDFGPMATRTETVPAFVEMIGDFHGEAHVVWGTGPAVAYPRGQGWACGLDANGGLWCKGLNKAGQLGLGHTNDRANWQMVSF